MTSSPKRSARGFGFRMLVITIVAAVASIGFGATSASAAPATLTWTQYKVYDSPYVVTNTCRTWLGYVSRDGANAAYAAGSGIASNGATGPDILKTSPFAPCASGGVVDPNDGQNIVFDAIAGSANPVNQSGSITFGGTYTYDSPQAASPGQAGHNFNIVIDNPKFVFNADGTAELRASGTNNADPQYLSYTDLKIFDLDLAAATCEYNPLDGSWNLNDVQPSLASTAAGFFTGSYPVGAGPDRTPNTFGTFTIENFPWCLRGPQGLPGADGANGTNGTNGADGAPGPQGKDGTNATIKSFKLKKATFGKKLTVVRVLKGKKLVGYAEVKGKKAKVFAVGLKKGTYTLKAVKGKKQVKIKVK